MWARQARRLLVFRIRGLLLGHSTRSSSLTRSSVLAYIMASAWVVKRYSPGSFHIKPQHHQSKHARHTSPAHRKAAASGSQGWYVISPHEAKPVLTRTSVRDSWESKKADLEKQLSEACGTAWTIDINPNAVYAYAPEDSYVHNALGAALTGYVHHHRHAYDTHI